jgi:hypothetical protein
MYNGESELFYLRLVMLDPYVDYFVVGHSCYTFQGDAAPPLSFAPLEREIAPFRPKMRIFETCAGQKFAFHSWDREAWLRDFLRGSIASLRPSPSDLVLSCDCDEIPTPAGMEWLIAHPPTTWYKLRGLYFIYTFRWWLPSAVWIKPSIVRWGGAPSFQTLRKEGRHRTRQPVLIHCTYCFPEIATIIRKLKSFCHHEFAFEPFTNPSYILAATMCGRSIIPAQGTMVEGYKGNIDELLPIRHPALDFLREAVGFRDKDLATRENVSYFLRYLNCTAPGFNAV